MSQSEFKKFPRKTIHVTVGVPYANRLKDGQKAKIYLNIQYRREKGSDIHADRTQKFNHNLGFMIARWIFDFFAKEQKGRTNISFYYI